MLDDLAAGEFLFIQDKDFPDRCFLLEVIKPVGYSSSKCFKYYVHFRLVKDTYKFTKDIGDIAPKELIYWYNVKKVTI